MRQSFQRQISETFFSPEIYFRVCIMRKMFLKIKSGVEVSATLQNVILKIAEPHTDGVLIFGSQKVKISVSLLQVWTEQGKSKRRKRIKKKLKRFRKFR